MNDVDSIYIETTIPSVYYEQRTEATLVARRVWTRQWWDEQRGRYRLFTSSFVFAELSRAEHPQRAEKLALLGGLSMLEANPAIAEIAEAYIKRFVMPRDPAGDAMHLALASFYRCDVLLTWNCVHLANASKAGHIRRVNTLLGLHVPLIVTPLELLGEDIT